MSVNTHDVSSDETLSLLLRILKTHYILNIYTIIIMDKKKKKKHKHSYRDRYRESIIYYISWFQ